MHLSNGSEIIAAQHSTRAERLPAKPVKVLSSRALDAALDRECAGGALEDTSSCPLPPEDSAHPVDPLNAFRPMRQVRRTGNDSGSWHRENCTLCLLTHQ